jgi:hypothetical protein
MGGDEKGLEGQRWVEMERDGWEWQLMRGDGS